MTQKDYILRIAEDVGRALAQIIYHKEIHDYQGALSLIDELFKQTVGMGSGLSRPIMVACGSPLPRMLNKSGISMAYKTCPVLSSTMPPILIGAPCPVWKTPSIAANYAGWR